MISYTAGIRKIAVAGPHWNEGMIGFFQLAYQIGYRHAAWNGDVYMLSLGPERGVEHAKMDLAVRDFAFGTDD